MFNNVANNFILSLTKEKKFYIIVSLFLNLLATFLNIFGTIIFISIILTALLDINFLENTGFTPFFEKIFVWGNVLNQNYSLIILFYSIILIFFLEKLVIHFNSVLKLKYTKYLIYSLKCKEVLLLSNVDVNYFTQNKTEDILFKINRETDKAALAIVSCQQIWIYTIVVFIFIIILSSISFLLTLITLSLIGLLFVINNICLKISKKRELILSQKNKIYNRQLIDFLLGIRQIKYLATEEIEYQQIANSIEDKHKAELDNQKNSLLINSINNIFPLAIALGLIPITYYLFEKEILVFIPIFLIYVIFLEKTLYSITQLKAARNRFISNRYSLDRVSQFLNELDKPKVKSGNLILDNLKSNIALQNLTFAYPNHARIILDKINLVIPARKTTALISYPTGGKSTLVGLLTRFYEPIEGNINIDSQDIKQYDISSLRKVIAIIEAEPFLFNNSIFYNLTYGLKNIPKDQVILVSQITKAYDFIINLPHGFATIIGKNQTIIADYQKQLLIITRALLLQPQIIILDNSLKNLDPREYQIVESALEKLCCDRTTIIIGDHLSNMEKVDQIAILNKGRIVESGTHQELLKNSSLYQRICSAKFKTSQQSHQQKLAKKISKKLASQTNNNLSYQIRNNLNSLLNYLQLINDGLIDDDLEQSRILDESYQSAKNMLASLREYERKLSQGFKKNSEED